MTEQPYSALLQRIADALERLAPAPSPATAFSGADLAQGDAADAYVWHPAPDRLSPVASVNRVDLTQLKGIASQRDTLIRNTRQFIHGHPANNALLWGARGTGKSSLVKAVHAHLNANLQDSGNRLILVEIYREDLPTLGPLLDLLRPVERQFLLFCDDLSFDGDDTHYKSLKAVLDGGIQGRPDNVIFYATSNRRHLMAREMIENERSTAIHTSESVDEKVSLSDRFGLWLGFHNLDQATYFEICTGYATDLKLDIAPAEVHALALEWSMTRGARSGRVAWQFIQDLAGKLASPDA